MYQKEHKWQQAINCYKRFMSENTGECDADTYVSYAKCLRVVGRTNLAEELLIEGKTLHPTSERILLEFHNLYDSLGDWKSAEVIANDLIKMNPEHANYYFRLGRTYAYLDKYKEAGESYKIGLQYRHNLSFEELVKKIQRGISDNPSKVSSQYTFINGRNNLGGLIHEYEGKKYFTKISRYTRGARRERIFYNKVCAEFPTLKQLVPSYIGSLILNNILYLTLEMIDDNPVTIDNAEDVLDISTKITAIKYEDIIKIQSNPKYLFHFRTRPITIVIFFTKIHEKYYNKILFSSFHRLGKQNNYSETAKQAIKRLENLIMGNYLYAFIKPEEHYSLLHGDYISQNMKLNTQENIPQVFDWATFTIGPRFMDVARYLTTTYIPYPEIKKLYLSKEQINGKMSQIEKIFFLYALILLYFLTPRKNMDEKLSEFILPALKDMEKLVKKFEKERVVQDIQLLLKERKKETVKIKLLKNEIQKLKEEKRELQERYKDILTSKSWRITAPLRKVIEWKNRH